MISCPQHGGRLRHQTILRIRRDVILETRQIFIVKWQFIEANVQIMQPIGVGIIQRIVIFSNLNQGRGDFNLI